MNEGPWSNVKGKRKFQARGFFNRFILSWATYFPGIIAGAFLSLHKPGLAWSPMVGLILASVLLFWWVVQTFWKVDPESFL